HVRERAGRGAAEHDLRLAELDGLAGRIDGNEASDRTGTRWLDHDGQTYHQWVEEKPRSRISASVSTSRPRNFRNASSAGTEPPTLMIESYSFFAVGLS